MVIRITNQIVFSATVSAGAVALGLIYLFYKKQKEQVPKKWKSVGKIKNLIIYPLKSGHRMELQTANCTEVGLQVENGNDFRLRDRSFVIYKESTKDIVLGKTYSKMLLINLKTSIKNFVTLDAPKMPTLILEVPKQTGEDDFVLAFGHEKIFSIDCGDEAAVWISSYLVEKPSGYRIGYSDASHKRIFDFKYFSDAYPSLINSTMCLFGDYATFLLMNQKSIDDVVSKVPESGVSVHNFRPNIVFDGLEPFAEDGWKFVKIGDAVFRVTKPCTRCAFTTANPDTAERIKQNEPLRTLSKYRKIKDISKIQIEAEEVALGVYLSLIQGAVINVGDDICVGDN